MGKKSVVILPETKEILSQMGAQMKIARLRRDLSVESVAQSVAISRATLWKIEKGDPSVAIGIYAAVLHTLNNMDTDLLSVAKEDQIGRMLQDINLTIRKRAPKGS